MGSGDRSERIRTYNFPQGRCTDHRINLTLYKLDQIIEGPALEEMVQALMTTPPGGAAGRSRTMPPDRAEPAAALAAAAAADGRRAATRPTLDARLLLQAAAGLSREDLILEPERCILTLSSLRRFERFIARRERHEPVSRILGEREFYGRVFRVTADTLDPRARHRNAHRGGTAADAAGRRGCSTSAPAPAPSP